MLLLEHAQEDKKDELEALNVVFKVAIASVLKGKDLKIFEDSKGKEEAKTFETKEDKAKELNDIFNQF